MPEIVPNLWQEPQPQSYDWERFDVICSMVGSVGGEMPEGKLAIILKTADADYLPNLAVVDPVARLLARHVLQGRRVMVHCGAGLNRSGLMVALVLWHMGMTPLRAVEMIRSAIPDALCNTHFDQYIRSL